MLSSSRRGAAAWDVGDDDDWSDMFAKILTLRVEPRLGLDRPLAFFMNTRSCEAALARVQPARWAGGGAVRALCLRRGTGQWLRRTDRSGAALRAGLKKK